MGSEKPWQEKKVAGYLPIRDASRKENGNGTRARERSVFMDCYCPSENDHHKYDYWLIRLERGEGQAYPYLGSKESLLAFSSKEKGEKFLRDREDDYIRIMKRSSGRVVAGIQGTSLREILEGGHGYWQNMLVDPVYKGKELVVVKDGNIKSTNKITVRDTIPLHPFFMDFSEPVPAIKNSNPQKKRF